MALHSTVMDRYDEEFNLIMRDIRENLSFLENEWDMMTLACWVSHLNECNSSPDEKARRNEYAKYLAYMLKRNVIHYPFIDTPPPRPLPPLDVDMDNPADAEAEEEEMLEEEESPQGPIHLPRHRQSPCLSVILEGSEAEDTQELSMTPPLPAMPVAASSPHRTQPHPRPVYFTPSPIRRIASSPPKIPPRQPQPARTSPPTTPRRDICHPKRPLQPRFSVLESPPCPAAPCRIQVRDPCPTVPPVRVTKAPPNYALTTTEVNEEPFSPPLPGTPASRASIERIVASVNPCTQLNEFMRELGPLTCDNGETMFYVTSSELAMFKEFVRSVYQTRNHDISELLAKEQMKLKERYEMWEARMMTRAENVLKSLHGILPNFNYENYKRDPEYVYLILRSQMSIEEKDLNPHARILRAKAQKKNWLNEEAQRIEKDNTDKMVHLREMDAQLAALSRSFNTNHKILTDKFKDLEDQAAKLRIRQDENQKLIDDMIDKINTPEATSY